MSRSRISLAHLNGVNRLNVRSAKLPDASVVGVVTDADRIKVNVAESDSEWINVMEPFYGYAMAKYLKVD